MTTSHISDEDIGTVPEGADEASVIAFADRLLREMGDLQRERKANEAACAAEIARVTNGWLDVNSALKRREERMAGYLERLVLLIPMRGKKTRDLGAGSIGHRWKPELLVVEDSDKAILWVKATCTQGERASVVRILTEEKLDKKALDNLVVLYAKTPDGCVVVPGHDEFVVKTSEPHA